MLNKIISLKTKVTKKLSVGYCLGMCKRPIDMTKEIAKKYAVKITFKGNDIDGKEKDITLEDSISMRSIREQEQPEVTIVGERASSAMVALEVLVASNFGLEPVLTTLDKEVDGASLVRIFQDAQKLHPTANLALVSGSASISNVVSLNQLKAIGFMSLGMQLSVEDPNAILIIREFQKALGSSNNNAAVASDTSLLTRGGKVPEAKIAVGEKPSVMDDIDFSLIPQFTKKEYEDAVQKVNIILSNRIYTAKLASNVDEQMIYYGRKMIANDNQFSYENLVGDGSGSIAQNLILAARKYIEMYKRMDDQYSENIVDIDETVVMILQQLEIENFQ